MSKPKPKPEDVMRVLAMAALMERAMPCMQMLADMPACDCGSPACLEGGIATAAKVFVATVADLGKPEARPAEAVSMSAIAAKLASLGRQEAADPGNPVLRAADQFNAKQEGTDGE